MGIIESHTVWAIWLTVGLPFWRAMSGHVAWKIHTTAKHPRGYRPEIEDWVFGAIVTCWSLVVWPVIGAFYWWPRRMTTMLEQDSERLAKQIRLDRLTEANERRRIELDRANERQQRQLEGGHDRP